MAVAGDSVSDVVTNDCNTYSVETFNCHFTPDSSIIFHHNIRSFNCNMDSLSVFLNSLNVMKPIIVLTETWFNANTSYEIDGYNGYHSFRHERGGGGVSIFILKSLLSSERPTLNLSEEIIETCCVKVSFNAHFSFNVLAMYRPPSKPCDDNFGNYLDGLLSENFVASDNVYMVGDLNVDLLSDSPSKGILTNVLASFGFIPLITQITHPSIRPDGRDSILDHVWTNQLTRLSSGVFDVDITDHYPVFVNLTVPCKSGKVRKSFRDHSVH